MTNLKYFFPRSINLSIPLTFSLLLTQSCTSSTRYWPISTHDSFPAPTRKKKKQLERKEKAWILTAAEMWCSDCV